MTARVNGQALPNGWEWVDVGRLIDVRTGATPLRSNSAYWQDGTIPWVTSGALNHLYIEQADEYITPLAIFETNAKLFPAGSLLVAMYGEGKTRGKVSELKIDAATNQACAALIFDHMTECLKSYIKLYFLKNYQDIRMLSSGGVQPNLNLSIIKQTQIPLAPLNEQHRIVAAIETQFTRLDAAVTALRRSQANLKRYRVAVLKAACEGRLVPTEAALAQAEGRSYEPAAVLLERILAERRRKWEAANPKKQYQEPVAPDTSELPELPEGWCWATIDQATINLDHMRVPINKEGRAERSGVIPYYGANGPVGWIDDYIFDEPLVLVVEDETFTGREKPFCYKISGKSWVNNHAHVLRAKAVTSEYLNYSLSYYPFTPLTTGTTGRRKLTKNALLNASYAIPPLAEQQRIVTEVERRLSLIDQLEKTIETDLARANRLRQSILKRAFAGKLVPQDPNDEPAAVLLERIREART